MKQLMNNKSGMFFTLIAIFLITLFFASYSLYDIISDRSAINDRIETLNSFVFSLEKDVSRYIYIVGFRSVFIFQNKIVDEGNPINNVSLGFEELFYNGTYDGNSETLMNGATFSDMVESFRNTALKINANVSFSDSHIFIEQIDPWNIHIVLTAKMIVSDLNNLVMWNKTLVSESFIPIENFEDPMYLLNTNNQITNKIRKSPYSVFVDGNDVSNLSNHVLGSYYVASDSAPNFIMRLEGINSPDSNGIESFVYLPKFSSQGFSIEDKSVVDYIYFSGNNPPYSHVTGMPSWFKIDNESNHFAEYGVGEIVY